MATASFFNETVTDASKPERTVALEIGRSSFLDGKNLIYLTIDGECFFLDEKTGRQLFEAMDRLGHYLGYDR